MLSKEAFNLSHNFIVNQMSLYRTTYSNPLAVLDHLFFGNSHVIKNDDIVSFLDVPALTRAEIELALKAKTSDGLLYNLYYHKYPKDSERDVTEIIFEDEINESYLEEIIGSNFNLDKNINTQVEEIFSIDKKDLKYDIKDQICSQSFSNSKCETYPLAYKDKRTMELLMVTANYKKGIMEQLANKAGYDLSKDKYYIQCNIIISDFNNIYSKF